MRKNVCTYIYKVCRYICEYTYEYKHMNVQTLPWMQAAVKYQTPADFWFYAACEFNNKVLDNDIGYRVTATGMRAFSNVEAQAQRVRKERAVKAMKHEGGGAAAGNPEKRQHLHQGRGGGALRESL